MDNATVVPISWMFWLFGILFAGVVWWLLDFRKANETQHSDARKGLRRVEQSVHRRIDHLILHLLPGHPYKPEEDEDGS